MKKGKRPVRTNLPKLIRDVIEVLRGESNPVLQPIPIPVRDIPIRRRKSGR